jgi:spermidine/putrescine transport system permease protein
MRDDFSSSVAHGLKWAYLLSVVLLLMSPVFYVIAISFNEHGFGARIYDFTYEWYQVVLSDTIMVESLKWTALLALVTVVVTVPMGLLAAKFYRRSRRQVAFLVLMLTPLFVPADIMGSALLVYFKNLNRLFESLGDTLGVEWFYGWFELGFGSAVVGLVIFALPYVFLVILITMSRYHDEQTEAARGCGATPWQAFWQVEFPQIRAGVLSSCAFAAILTFNETTRTALLKGGFDTFSNVLVSQMLNIGMSGESYAMAGMMSMLSMLVIGGVLLYTMLRSERLERQARARAEPPGV